MGSQKKTPPANLRPRHEPPTLEEALYAAEGFIDERDRQIEFAAELMDLPIDLVRPKAEAFFKAQANTVQIDGIRKPVIVEKRSAAPFSVEHRSTGFTVERKSATPAFSFERKSPGAKFVVETRKRVITLPR